MKNKKADVDPLKVIIGAAILLLVAGIIIWGPIRGMLLGKQFPFVGGKTEEVTTDCDEDEIVGLSDQCPCVGSKNKKSDLPCGLPDAKATENCPVRCKATT